MPFCALMSTRRIGRRNCAKRVAHVARGVSLMPRAFIGSRMSKTADRPRPEKPTPRKLVNPLCPPALANPKKTIPQTPPIFAENDPLLGHNSHVPENATGDRARSQSFPDNSALGQSDIASWGEFIFRRRGKSMGGHRRTQVHRLTGISQRSNPGQNKAIYALFQGQTAPKCAKNDHFARAGTSLTRTESAN